MRESLIELTRLAAEPGSNRKTWANGLAECVDVCDDDGVQDPYVERINQKAAVVLRCLEEIRTAHRTMRQAVEQIRASAVAIEDYEEDDSA